MRQFLAIVGIAVVVFILASMVQESETFSQNWFKPPAVNHGTDADRRDAANAVYMFRSLSAHFYGTGGDRRFAERIPASQPVIDELLADAEYVGRNGRRETPRLVRIEMLSSEAAGGETAVVTTREFWVTQYEWLAGGESDPQRSDIEYFRYRLSRDGARWIVTAWDPADAPQSGGPQ